MQDKDYRTASLIPTAELPGRSYNFPLSREVAVGTQPMSNPAAASADHLSTCYREIAGALRQLIPTLRNVKSREELESVAACYEKLAAHRDGVCLVAESAAEPRGR